MDTDASARPSVGPAVLPVRERSRVTDEILAERLETILPAAMRAAGLDMWLVVCQEDNLDPLLPTMVPEDCWYPILQILVFHDPGGAEAIERINLSMTDTRELYERPWQGRREEEQWSILRRIVDERDPARIGIDIGPVQWAAGGLPHHLYERLVRELSPRHAGRLVSAEQACIRWLAVLSPVQLQWYEHVVETAGALIEECYSEEAITPGVTTAQDLHWRYRQRCADLGLQLAFTPSFYLTAGGGSRRAGGESRGGARDERDEAPIRRGDLVRCDVGIRYLGLCTDHQRQLYLPRRRGAPVPDGLRRLMDEAHRLQDVFLEEIRPGITGNDALRRILTRARREGIPGPKVYSHSLGMFLHEPGALIGLPWEQERCPGRGDVEIAESTCYTMELSVEDTVEKWGRSHRLGLEEDVLVADGECRVIGGRQEGFYTL